MEIEVGQIWVVTRKGFTVKEEIDCICGCGHSHKREILKEIPRNSKIEIRYPYEWHFRTEQNTYHHAKPDHIIDKCAFFGTIHNEIRFNNRHTLSQILEENLYKKDARQEIEVEKQASA